MGKRELLIIVAFAAVIAVVYQITAPPAKPGEGFSFSRLFQRARQNMRGNAATAHSSDAGSIPIGPAITQLRVTGVGKTKIFGEDRRDIAYELEVESNGPDEATALQYARQTVLTKDDLGSALALKVTPPREGTQNPSLVLHVPAKLPVKLSGVYGGTVKGVVELELDISGGSVTAEGVTGAVTGYHRQSDITVIECASVDLTLAGSRARFSHVLGKLTLNARSGRAEIRDSAGPIQIDGASQELEIVSPRGTVRITARDGRIKIDRPHAETKVEAQSTEVDVTIEEAVPMTLLTSERPLRLWFAGSPAVTLDVAATEGGNIQTPDNFPLTVERSAREQRAHQVVGADGPRITLRNTSASIVIGKPK
jgi:Toastrack DUF4097